MPNLNFDSDLVKDENTFDVIPEGWYQARAVKSELKTTKAGTGTYMNFQFEILGPAHQGRVVFHRYTVTNANEKAVRIGQTQLKGLVQATGKTKIQATEELHDRVIGILVKVSPARGEYGPSNEIRDYCSSDIFSEVQDEYLQKMTNAVASGAKPLSAQGDPWALPTSDSSPFDGMDESGDNVSF